MVRKILISGGTGFLGQRLAKDLKASWQVTISGRNNKQGFLAEKAAFLGDIEIDGGDATAGVGDDDALERRLGVGGRAAADEGEPGENNECKFHLALDI